MKKNTVLVKTILLLYFLSSRLKIISCAPDAEDADIELLKEGGYEMFVLHVEMKLKEGKADELYKIYSEIYPLVKEEKGCTAYKLTFTGDKTQAAMFEIWESEEDLALHGEQPHIKKLFSVFPDVLAGKPEATKYEISEIKRNAI